MRSKTSRGVGLVPRWGGGGAWQNPRCQFAVPSHNSSFSYLGVPAPAGMSDWYENALKRLLSTPANPYIRHSREGGNPRTNISRKSVNRDTTTYVHTATPLRLSGESTPRTPIRRRNPERCGRGQFSYLGVPVATGMSDWYENDVTRRRVCLNAAAPALVVPAPQFVIPAIESMPRTPIRGRESTH